MPKVRREVRPFYVETVRVPWAELTPHERQKVKERRIDIGLKVAGVALVGASIWWVAGSPGHAAPREDARQDVFKAASAAYQKSPVRERFEAQYIRPITVNKEMSEGGKRILGWLWAKDAADAHYTFGQTCLAGSAYDTSPSEIRGRSSGDISAVAALAVSGGDVTVYPAGSDAPSLSFSITNGELVPDESTVETLVANGCNPDSALQIGLNNEDGYYDVSDVLGILDEPALHAGE